MISISLCMIVKNEERVLSRCLESIKDLVDEIIIVDTGSEDRTKEIAEKYTDKVYDFPWNDNFADARNFSFSKAQMDYIYCADADEVLDETNRLRFRQLKQVLLPEIDIVQMVYVNDLSNNNTTENYAKEYRPKLYKRLRQFVWQDPVHESVMLEPVVYDSEVEILHKPEGLHGARDFRVFRRAIERGERLSKKLHNMYARELLIAGASDDLIAAKGFFEESYTDDRRSLDEKKEAACVLAQVYRLEGQSDNFFKLALKDMVTTPCAEMCLELGRYFQEKKDFEEACVWYYNAAYETESILDIRCQGILPLQELAETYKEWANAVQECNAELAEQCLQLYEEYRQKAEAWMFSGGME